MAIEVIEGKVSELEVFGSFAWVKIEEKDTNDTTLIIVWSDVAEDYTPLQRLVHGNWMAMLRDALVHCIPVDVGHDEALMTSVSIGPRC